MSAFKERQSSKNLLSCENSDRDGHFRRTETDFSNLFARGSFQPLPSQHSPTLPGPVQYYPVGFLLGFLDFFLKFNYLDQNYHDSFQTVMKLFFQYLNIIYSLLLYGPGLRRFGSWMRAVSKNSQLQRHMQGQIWSHRLSESEGILHIRKSSDSCNSIYPPMLATTTKSLCGKLCSWDLQPSTVLKLIFLLEIFHYYCCPHNSGFRRSFPHLS